MNAPKSFKNLLTLLEYFSDEQKCRNYLEEIRWDGKLKCAYADCQHDKVFKFQDGKTYKCAKCRRKYSVKVGTIFEDSKICLRKWFACVYLITAHKKGISSLQLSRDLSITQKSTWFMLHRVRHALSLNYSEAKLFGEIEADECFIGGAEANKHKNKRTPNTQGRSALTKTPVIGVIQRGGELRVKVITDTKAESLRPFLLKNVEFGSILNTDEWQGYNGLGHFFKRKIVDHSKGQYVNESCHTNSVEGFWSLLKRGVNGIYHSISKKHSQNYVDEFSFRYNTRNMGEDMRFNVMLSHISSHITYKELIAKNNPPQSQQGTLAV